MALSFPFLATSPRVAYADNPLPSGPEFHVNTYTTGHQSGAVVAMDAGGNFIVVWQSFDQDGSSYEVYAQRYNASGVAQGEEFRVNTYTTDSEAPSVAMDADGDFVITWWNAALDENLEGVYVRRYNADGVAQGSEFRVNTYTTGLQQFPRVAMDTAGDFVIAWSSTTQDAEIYARRYDASGVPQGGEFRVNTYTASYQYYPDVAMDANGDFVIAWQSDDQDGSGSGIYAQRFNAGGIAQGAEFRVNTAMMNYQCRPSVAMDAAGNFVIAWYTWSLDDGYERVYAQRYSANGIVQGSEFRVSPSTIHSSVYPDVVMDVDGDFLVTWEGWGPDEDYSGIYTQHYSAIGVAEGPVLHVNTSTIGRQYVPNTAIDTDEEFVVVWSSSNQFGIEGEIYARRYVNPTAKVYLPLIIRNEQNR